MINLKVEASCLCGLHKKLTNSSYVAVGIILCKLTSILNSDVRRVSLFLRWASRLPSTARAVSMPAAVHRVTNILHAAALHLVGRLATSIPGSGSLILCMHSVVPERSVPYGQAMAVTQLFLEAVVAQLRRSGVAILALADGIARLERNDHRPFVCLTFDDGYRDFHDVVFPMALHLDVPVTSFVTTGLVEGTTPMWWNALERAIADVDVLIWRGGRRIIAAANAKRALHAEATQAFRLLDVEGQRALLDQLAADNPLLELRQAYDAA